MPLPFALVIAGSTILSAGFGVRLVRPALPRRTSLTLPRTVAGGARTPIPGVGGLMTPVQSFAAFAASTDHWSSSAPPAGAYTVPLVPAAYTPIDPAQVGAGGDSIGGISKWWTSRSLYRTFGATVRAALSAAGRGDEDWRCVIFRWGTESNWGTRCFNMNCGNIHAKPYGTLAGILAGNIVIDPSWQNVAGGAIVNDNGQIVVEYAFNSLADWCRYEKQWLLKYNYNPTIAGFQQGGLDGLKAAILYEDQRGYAEGGNPVRGQQYCENFWYRARWSGQSVLGNEWTRDGSVAGSAT
jgi:hypothetical protein